LLVTLIASEAEQRCLAFGAFHLHLWQWPFFGAL